MGKKIIVANWKMNFSIHQASLFIHQLAEIVDAEEEGVEVILGPSLLALQSVALQNSHHGFKLAAQNFYWRDSGPYTGEVSATQLRGLVQYAFVGHSERRHVFGERDRDIRNKVQAAFRNEITPILCIGETISERTLGETNDIIHDQLIGGLSNITSTEVSELVIAYEPVWAIGTGENAKPQDAEDAVKVIRNQIRHLFGAESARKVRVLYGGSVTTSNASSYLNIEGVDGLFVGGASLDVQSFSTIIKKASPKKLVSQSKRMKK